jgi:(4S)-4-hydroxy-5-phosphonooxypentane-2,3-dione isomerase
MFVVLVNVHVKAECVEEFKIASLDNARNSILESGVARFDIYQQVDDPTQFSLIEIYRTEDAPNKHRETAHYSRWSSLVSGMMAEPRTKVNFNILFPPISEI